MLHIQRPGARVGYSVSGEGPAVLLLQGCGVAGEGWRPQIEALRSRHRVVAVDNRGIDGRPIDKALSIELMAQDALAVMDNEKLDRFHVVGHSMGGLLAQQIALTSASRVRSLAFLCSFHVGKEGAALSLGMLVTALRMRIGSRPMRRNAFLELVMPPSYLATVDKAELAACLAPLFGHDLADQPAVVMRQVRAMAAYDARDRLMQLAAFRTLVVSATEDRIARPAYGQRLAAAIPGSRYVEISDAGHGVVIQKAAVVNELLVQHFAGA